MSRRWFEKRSSLKIFSILFACALWLYVLNSARVKFEKTLTVEYQIQDHLVFGQKPQSEVTFMMEAPRAFAQVFQSNQDKIVVDLRTGKIADDHRGWHNFNSHDIMLPLGVRVTKVTPSRSYIKLERKVSKMVPIKLRFKEVNEQRRIPLKSIKIVPKEIEVVGPSSVMSQLKAVETQPVEFLELDETGVVSSTLVLPNELMSFAQEAQVSIELTR